MIVGSLPTTMAEYRKALEAARTEGRQQAVRLIEDAENLIRSYVPEGSRLREQWLSEVAGANDD